ncbi:uncharacterized protein LY89DRAFT_144487 [Mollisia scopiformis]|uniref:Uncharacterized protein n=1 Tax=Mollisia scopiformis TaxID=149040 RepID=A0A194X103_MOLSC|nr:uncharacterized protein LY89DRAFT_144487 [Mollisia scopiformis]KUJ13649.1 hypothetical protein LY89DRAFT_144487 [Mollisia scopiformis]
MIPDPSSQSVSCGTKNRDSSPTPNTMQLVTAEDESEVEVARYMSADVEGNEGDVEGIIVTAGARSVERSIRYLNDSVPDDETEEEVVAVESEKVTSKRQNGFPSVKELPSWFPKNIKKIYRVERHGGALSFKELNLITRYRNLVEIIHRRTWKRYLKAGKARWQLQKVIGRHTSRSLTKAFFEHRKKQFTAWKTKALRAWKKLEKVHRGTLILDETININFRQERMIYAKKLRRSM